MGIVEDTDSSRSAIEPGELTTDIRTAVVLALLMRKVSAADAAAAMGVAETVVTGWIDRFIAAGRTGLAPVGRSPDPAGDAAPRHGPRSAAQLRVENRALRAAISEMRGRTQMWRIAAEDTVGPCATLR